MIHALKKYDVLRDIIDRCNAVVVERIQDNQLREANIALESFNNGGKRLRPILLVLSAKAPNGGRLGDIDESLVQLAGAVELVHLATLFHDDVIDQVDTRRTKLSARLKYGNYASVLSGDFARPKRSTWSTRVASRPRCPSSFAPCARSCAARASRPRTSTISP